MVHEILLHCATGCVAVQVQEYDEVAFARDAVLTKARIAPVKYPLNCLQSTSSGGSTTFDGFYICSRNNRFSVAWHSKFWFLLFA